MLSYNTNSLSYVGANEIVGTPLIDTGISYMYIQGVKLNNDGLVYIIVGDSTVWDRDPLISEIKQGTGPNGLPALHYRVLTYKTADSRSGNMAWTSLPSGSLKLYLLPSDNNPFDTANFGSMQSYDIAQEVQWGYRITVAIVALLLMLWI